MHKTTSSSQVSAMEVSLQQPQACMDWHINWERCFWAPVLGLCSLGPVGVRCLILVKISSSSFHSFTWLTPFRSLVLWSLLSQFIWPDTLNDYFMCEPCLQLELEAVPGLCKWKIQKEKNPHISAWQSSSLKKWMNDWSAVTGVCLTETPLGAFRQLHKCTWYQWLFCHTA